MTESRVPAPDAQFFETLAGRTQGQSGADTMRTVLLEEASTVESAMAYRAAAPTPEQLALRERIRARLMAEGALNKVPAGPSRAKRAQDGAITQLLAWLTSFNGPQIAGLAASLMLGVLVVMSIGPRDQTKEDVMRGGGSLSVSVADPAGVGAQLVERIQALGGQALLVQINDKEWAMSVAISKAEAVKPVRALLQQSGFKLEGPPPYDLILQRSAR